MRKELIGWLKASKVPFVIDKDVPPIKYDICVAEYLMIDLSRIDVQTQKFKKIFAAMRGFRYIHKADVTAKKLLDLLSEYGVKVNVRSNKNASYMLNKVVANTKKSK